MDDCIHGQVFTHGYDSGGAQWTTVKFDHDVVVSAGKTQSFEVHTVSSRIMVQLFGREGMLAGQDMALEVRARRIGAQSPAAFGGIIEYDGLDDNSHAGGRSKSAKAKAAKLKKDDTERIQFPCACEGTAGDSSRTQHQTRKRAEGCCLRKDTEKVCPLDHGNQKTLTSQKRLYN